MYLYTDHTLQSAAGATGDGTVIDMTDAALGAATRIAVQVTGTFVGTVTFEATLDGTNYATVGFLNAAGGYATGATSTGVFFGNISGVDKFRARVSAYTSGAITVTARVLWER